MADNDNNGFVLLGIGLILGTIFTYIFLTHKGTASQAPPTQIQYLPFPYPQSAQPNPPANPDNIISVVPVPSCTPPALIPPHIPTIQNDETWDIKKDRRGRLDKIIVHRQVKPAG